MICCYPVEAPYNTDVITDGRFTYYGSGDFRRFLLCNLDLDPMTFTYELDPYCLEIYWTRQTVCRQTDKRTKIICIPRRSASGQKVTPSALPTINGKVHACCSH